jgi:hypothetical protein
MSWNGRLLLNWARLIQKIYEVDPLILAASHCKSHFIEQFG